MGHNIDPNQYNKIMKLHPSWAESQYELAEGYLNILSEDPRKIDRTNLEQLVEKRVRERLANEHDRIEQLRRQVDKLTRRIDEMLEKKG